MSAFLRHIFEDDMVSAARSSNLGTPLSTGDMGSKTTERDVNCLVGQKTTTNTRSGLSDAAGTDLRASTSRVRTLTDRLDRNKKTGIQTCEAVSAIRERVGANKINLSEISRKYDNSFRALEEANQQLQDRLAEQGSTLAQISGHRLGEQKKNVGKAIANVREEFETRFEALEHLHREQMDEFRTHHDDFSTESSFYFQELNQILDEKERAIATAYANLDNDFDLRFRNLEHICQDRAEQLEKRQDNIFAEVKQMLDTQNQLVAQSVTALKSEYDMIFEKLAISTREMREAVEQHENSAKEMKATTSTSIPTSYSSKATIDQYSSRIRELEDDNKALRKLNRKLNKKITRQESRFIRKKDFDRLKAEVADLKASFAANR